ncbi:hypothetical protein [Asanoa sp. NPDC049475]|uniref:hypothetical protein n=1 Tax=Asanoa sp. NPDC049475 TaxID=3154728 RepID=UPI003443E983
MGDELAQTTSLPRAGCFYDGRRHARKSYRAVKSLVRRFEPYLDTTFMTRNAPPDAQTHRP